MNKLAIYKIVQIATLSLLNLYLFVRGYPLLDVIVVTLSVLFIIAITKIRETAIGMILATHNSSVKKLLKDPPLKDFYKNNLPRA